MTTTELIFLVLFILSCIVLQFVMMWRFMRGKIITTAEISYIEKINQDLQSYSSTLVEQYQSKSYSFLETMMQSIRQELINNTHQLQQTLTTQITSIATLQNNQIDNFLQQLTKLSETNALQLENIRYTLHQEAKYNRAEQSTSIHRFSDTLNQTLFTLGKSNADCIIEIRSSFEAKIKDLEINNKACLDKIRQTVDEKLHDTLEQRLGESFKLVSDRLEKVHYGLGEMQKLAIGVGDLKRILTNVKTRGTWGEVQLEMLLSQILTIDQYSKNVEIISGSHERVEFAVKLPNNNESIPYIWLPIDAKFPKEQYERLLDAIEQVNIESMSLAGRELERVVHYQAKKIAEKYLSPPLTTDFAILFLPTEGLYAEVMRRPGLSDNLQRTLRISIAGPSTLLALLNSLQMGLRTLALERRSSEVWQVLGAVKTEFSKFGSVLAATKNSLQRAAKNIEQAEVRSRQMTRKLKSVETLPENITQKLLENTNVAHDNALKAEIPQ